MAGDSGAKSKKLKKAELVKLIADTDTKDSSQLIKSIPSQTIDDNLSTIVKQVNLTENTCSFQKCRVRISLIGQDCQLCVKRFCFKHALPEVHGCGTAIKIVERKNFLHPKPAKKLNEEKELIVAKKRLDEKLKSMQTNRKQKPGGSGSKNTTDK